VIDHRLPRHQVWWYLRQYADGTTRYAFSNAPVEWGPAALDEAALLRWPIEQCFEECKSFLGMKDYESRSWTAWHRHMLYVMIAHLIVIGLRIRFKKKLPSSPYPWPRN